VVHHLPIVSTAVSISIAACADHCAETSEPSVGMVQTEQQTSSTQQQALTWKHPCSRHARAMSWMASVRVAGSLPSLARLMTGSGRGEDDEDGSIRCTWLAMEAGKKQAGMPRRQPPSHQFRRAMRVIFPSQFSCSLRGRGD